MRAVLGIDAAWTATQPSGVALAIEEASGWRLIAAAASYGHFLHHADGAVPDISRPIGSIPNAAALLTAASRLCGRAVDIVAIDMPMARTPIVSRRPADDAVSRAYGARKCSTHSPSAVRPGPISDDLRAGFEAAGYPLRTDAIAARGLIEVYPHPALVELAGAAERLPYKAGKVGTYWKDAAPSERRRRLLDQWRTIVALLDREMAGVAAALPPPAVGASGIEMKAYEDMIDATVCTWIGITALAGRATAYGDANAAIWIPMAYETRRP